MTDNEQEFNEANRLYDCGQYVQAVEWYRKAAEQDHPASQHELGLCYYRGNGVEKDYDKALAWWRKSAENGSAIAQLKMGLHYYADGAEQDMEKALEWFTKAAEQGEVNAQRFLEQCLDEKKRQACPRCGKAREDLNEIVCKECDEILEKEHEAERQREEEKYRKEREQISPAQWEEFKNQLKPLIKDATRLIIKPAPGIPEDSHLKSHFGGQPYFEKGEEWPVNKDTGEKLQFVFQIYNDGNMVLPKNIKLLQFYLQLEEWGPPSENKDDGWQVKIYETLNTENSVIVERQPKVGEKPVSAADYTIKYAEIEYEAIKTLPDDISYRHHWKGNTVSLRIYHELKEELIGKHGYSTQLGGYPYWMRRYENPNSDNFDLLFQLDSDDDFYNEGEEENIFGVCGQIYIHYNAKTKEAHYGLQYI